MRHHRSDPTTLLGLALLGLLYAGPLSGQHGAGMTSRSQPASLGQPSLAIVGDHGNGGVALVTLALLAGAGTGAGASVGNGGRGFGRAYLAASASAIPALYLVSGGSVGGSGLIIPYAAIQGLVGAYAALSAGGG